MNTVLLIGGLSLTSAAQVASPAVQPIAIDDAGVLSVAEHIFQCWPGPHAILFYGYMTSQPLGSYSPAGISDGRYLVELYDQTNNGCKVVTGSTLSVAGFATDPGRRWLASVTCNGVTHKQSTTIRFYFEGSIATWEWTEQFGLKSSVGEAIHCTVSHT